MIGFFTFIFSLVIHHEVFAAEEIIRPGKVTVRVSDLPTFDNFSHYILSQETAGQRPHLGTKRPVIEQNIHQSLKDDPDPFLGDLSPDAVRLTLQNSEGVYILQRVDGVLTLAAQDLAEEANQQILKTTQDKDLNSFVTKRIEKIKKIEVKRDELAKYITKVREDSNFNSIFEYMIQSHFRKPNKLTQGLMWPARVQNLIYGKKNKNITAFATLKAMVFEVFMAPDQTSPLIQVRRMKINSTAQMVPFFKPNLHAWEVEAFYFKRKNEKREAAGSKTP